MREVRIGCSGWSYGDWRGVLYPPGVPASRWLETYASEFDTVEVNATFYRLAKVETVRGWAEQVPDGFLFAVKASRYLTHMRRLRGIETGIERFWEPLEPLRESGKLGPVLWQLPERVEFDAELLEGFCSLLPSTMREAAELAERHDEKVKRVEVPSLNNLAAGADAPILHALEPRHSSFADARAADIVRRHGVAMVLADTAGRFPVFDEPTAAFVYARLHGGGELYTSGYDERSLRIWADRMLRQSAVDGADHDI